MRNRRLGLVGIFGLLACTSLAQADTFPVKTLRNGFFPIPGTHVITSVTCDGLYATGYASDQHSIIRWTGPRALGDGVIATLPGPAAVVDGNPVISDENDKIFTDEFAYDILNNTQTTTLSPYGTNVDGTIICGSINNTTAVCVFDTTTNHYVENSPVNFGGSVNAISAAGVAFGGYEAATNRAFTYTPQDGVKRPLATQTTFSVINDMTSDPYALGYCGEGFFPAQNGDYAFVVQYNGTANPTITTIPAIRGGDVSTAAYSMTGDYTDPIVVGDSFNAAGQPTGFFRLEGANLQADQVLSSRGANVGNYTIVDLRCVKTNFNSVVCCGQAKDATGNLVGFVASFARTALNGVNDQTLDNYWMGAQAFAKNDQLNGYFYIGYWVYFDALNHGATEHDAEVKFYHIYAYVIYIYLHNLGQESNAITQYYVYANKT